MENIKNSDKVVLWGGGVWNWFDPLTAIYAIEKISKNINLLDEFRPQAVVISKNSLDYYQPKKRKDILNKLEDYIRNNKGYLVENIKTPHYGPIKIYLLEKNIR